MARPRKPQEEVTRITDPLYTIGYAVQRKRKHGTVWCTRIGKGSYLATPYRGGNDAVIQAVREMLTERIEKHLEEVKNRQKGIPADDDSEVVHKPASIADLILEYVQAKRRDASLLSERQFKSARRFYLKDTRPVNDAAVRAYLLEQHQKATISRTSQRSYLTVLRPLFDYAVELRYMKTNPVQSLKLPDIDTRKIPPYSPEQVRAILEYFEARADLREVYLVLKLESLTAMRIREIAGNADPAPHLRDDEPRPHAAGLMRRLVYSDHFVIIGKGGRPRMFSLAIPDDLWRRATRKRPDPVAVARLEWLTEIRAVLAELMASRPHADGRLIGRKAGSIINRLGAAVKELNIPDEGEQSTHRIRKAAIEMMEHTLRLDRAYRTRLSGHSEKVAQQAYERPHTALEDASEMYLS